MDLQATEYYGEVVKRRNLSSYHLSLTTYPGQFNAPLHRHPNPYMSLNLGAAYSEMGKNNAQVVNAGMIIVRPANYTHENFFSESKGVCFNVEIVDGKDLYATTLFEDIRLMNGHVGFYKVLSAFVSDFRNDELESLVLEALIADSFSAKTPKKQSWYYRVVDRIQEEYDSKLTIASLAETADVHPNYLARKFKELHGSTLGEHIRNVRSVKGYCLLASKKETLTEISLQAGFYDQSHFTRTCRVTFGRSPKEILATLEGLI